MSAFSRLAFFSYRSYHHAWLVSFAMIGPRITAPTISASLSMGGL